MSIVRRILGGLLAAVLLAGPCLPGMAEDRPSQQALIERLVVSYAAHGETDQQALAGLSAADPALAAKWARIMDLWKTPVEVHTDIPADLPGDSSLCLVVLGFQLNADGTMRPELVERLKVALAAARQYPEAVIVCTGGGTASNDPTATEASRMAAWLLENGVDASRVYAEDRSLTTAQNAVFTFDLLQAQCPQVTRIVIISSDYHIATGTLLFGAEAILRDSPVTVAGNAAWHAPSGALSAMFQAGALIELSGDMKTAYDIYYDTYDIHELPPLPGGGNE